MLQSMNHRGPDDRGIYSDDLIRMGMVRLAILDLSQAGHQPMQSRCARYWIVYNGECYNFREIRRKLELSGCTLISNSDTEVVLQAYIKWGEACLTMMNGMFAFAIWDTEKKTLFAARDRLGIKPFYYAVADGNFVFASEVKAILSSGLVNFDLEPESVMRYFTFGYVQQPQTIVKDVCALMPGHSLRWKEGNLQIQSYWGCDHLETTIDSYQDAKEQLLNHIRRSVKMQMISDRPLGLYLSGGLDSAAVLAGMAHEGAEIRTFSIGFESNPYAKDESIEAMNLAEHFGAVHEQIMLQPSDALQSLPDFFASLDQPSIDGFNTFLVSKYASKSMTVALSGLGGDELFAGYSRHALLKWKSEHKGFQFFSRIIPLSVLARNTGQISELFWKMRAYGESSDFLLNYAFSRTVKFGRQNSIFTDDTIGHLDYIKTYKNTFAHLDNAYLQGNTLKRIQYLDLYAFMSSLLLRDMDVTSMAHSIEVRFPLIDHELVEFAIGLPDNFKLNRSDKSRPKGEGHLSYRMSGCKRILLDVMEPSLPVGFADRPKNGFKLPLAYWITRMERKSIASLLFDEQKYWERFCKPSVIERLFERFLANEIEKAVFWKILTFLSVITNLQKACLKEPSYSLVDQ